LKRSKTWIKRKLLTFEFKGRKRRALLWRKRIYEEWFYCARLCQLNGGKIPRDFGDLTKFGSFEDWWRDPNYGFELFCEPFIDSYAELVDRKGILSTDEVLLKVNLNGDPEIILRDIKLALSSKLEGVDYQSRARYKPSLTMKYLRIEKIRKSRQVWELSQEGKKQREIVEELGMPVGATVETFEVAIRRVQRYKAAYNKSLKNVELGSFP
jgi:hypothetical protein